MLAGLYGPEIPAFDGNALTHFVMFLAKALVMSFVCLSYGRE